MVARFAGRGVMVRKGTMDGRRVVILAALVGAAACGGAGSGRRAEPPPLPVGEANAAPATAASAYKAPPADVTGVEERVREAVLRALGRDGRRVQRDTSVDAACRATSEVIAAGGDPEMIPAHLRHALHGEQVVDAAYLPFTFGMGRSGAVPPGLLALVSTETTGRHLTHVGVGAAPRPDGGVEVTVVMLRRMVSLSAFPRKVTAHAEQVLFGELTSPMVRSPHVVLAGPDGSIADLLARARGQSFAVTVPFRAGEGRYVLQVLAEDAYGPQVASQLEIDAGDVPPLPTVKVLPAAPQVEGTGRDALERQMVALVNDYRASLGLPRLTVDPRLVASARLHSQDMRDSRYFGHRSPVKGELAQRLRDAGVPPALVLENIAMSVSIPWAHDRLVDSPSHRRNLIDPRVNRIGVGVAVREAGNARIVYVTEHLARLEGP